MITFLKWYYKTQTTNLVGILMGIFSMVSETFAIRIMLQHITEPLYQDFTRSGRVIGFLIRSGRIVIGAIVELVVILILGFLIILWLLLPAIIILKILYILFTLKLI